jgi:hypothetical protein
MVLRPTVSLSLASIVRGMEEFTQLFGNLLAFVYHCFDRRVIHGYLSGLSRPEQVVYFVRQVLGLPMVGKEVLSQRTSDYRNWVEAYLRPQPSHSHRVGGKGSAQRRLRVTPTESSGEEEGLRGLLHLQEHGTRSDISHQRA